MIVRMRYAAWILAAGLAVGAAAGASAQQSVEQRVDALMKGFACASLDTAVGADGPVQVLGRVASAEDLQKLKADLTGIAGADAAVDVDVVGRPFCETLEVMERAITANQQSNLGLRILPSNRTGVYREGEPLTLDVAAAAYQSYVYIDYFQLDGRVVHMLPNDKDKANTRSAGQRFLVGDAQSGQRVWPIYPPFGREMVTIVAAERPLFAAPRPEIEGASAYLAAMRDALKVLGEATVAAATLDINSEPKAGASTPQVQAPTPAKPAPPAKTPAPAKPSAPPAATPPAKPAP
jgi:hypothetical protein